MGELREPQNKIMNVYDFDGTIYHGDSTRDFYFYLLKRHVGIVKYLPATTIEAIRYMLGIVTKTKMKETFYRFLNDFSDGEIEKEVSDFWETNKSRIYNWYYDKRKNDDVIISASPSFILSYICKELNVTLICSEVDVKNGDYIGFNCHDVEKVKRFYEKYPNAVIDEFYSDSKSDEPLARLAKKAYLVKKDGRIVHWKL